MAPDLPQSNISGAGVPVCIPARWAATRFPGKLLSTLADGRTVLETTVGIALAADCGPVFVLAADERIERAAAGLGVFVRRSIDPAGCGSERIAEALRRGWLGDPMPTVVLNLQGDAVGASPELLRAALAALEGCPEAGLGTVAVPAGPTSHPGRTTVLRRGCRAVDFAREPLHNPEGILLHVGIYAYRSASLLELATLPPGPRESAVSLEQLRWLEQGRAIGLKVVRAPAAEAHAIDSPKDIQAAF
jgi:3-deoxy-manno-octulosonate cytidylyltransferase (CMP-KDO synthetase)